MDHQPAPESTVWPAYTGPPPAGPPARPAWNGKTSGYAIAALSLTLLGCIGPLSLVFAVLAIRQTRNGDRRGRFYAVAALVINGLVLLVIAGAVVVNLAQGPDRAADGTVQGERSISLGSLRVGDCIKDISAATGAYVDVVPCAQPHVSEVFAQFTLPGDEWPGREQARKASDSGCEKRFPGYAGAELDSRTTVLSLPPDAAGRLDVTCLTFRLSPTTGSVRR